MGNRIIGGPGGPEMGGNGAAGQAGIGVTPQQIVEAPLLRCAKEGCENYLYDQVFVVKMINTAQLTGIVGQPVQEQGLHIPVFVCTSCGTVQPLATPEPIRKVLNF